MAADLKKDLDYTPVLQALIEKSTAGKLDWQETAAANTFTATAASGKGVQTFVASRYFDQDKQEYQYDLTVQDEAGNKLFEVTGSAGGPVGHLFTLAHRIAKQIDEKIDETVDLLNAL